MARPPIPKTGPRPKVECPGCGKLSAAIAVYEGHDSEGRNVGEIIGYRPTSHTTIWSAPYYCEGVGAVIEAFMDEDEVLQWEIEHAQIRGIKEARRIMHKLGPVVAQSAWEELGRWFP